MRARQAMDEHKRMPEMKGGPAKQREIEDNSRCYALDAREAAATSKPFASLPSHSSLIEPRRLAVNELPFGSCNVLDV